MNTEPATEYAVFLPESQRYVTDVNGWVAAFPTEAMANQAGQGAKETFEIHTRRNYMVTQWRAISRVESFTTAAD